MDVINRVIYELDEKDDRTIYVEDFDTTVDLEIVGEFKKSEVDELINILTKVKARLCN